MKRVFIISANAMFSYGLRSLLWKETDFQIIAQEDDISLAIEQLEALQPDVVIVDTGDALQDYLHHILCILTTVPTIKIVGLSLQHNNLHIYQIDRWVVREVSDLVEAIENPV